MGGRDHSCPIERAVSGPGTPRGCPPRSPTPRACTSHAHPVPHLMNSRPARSVVVTWTWFRSRCTCQVSLQRLMRRHPLPSTGSLGMVPPLQRYYGTLRLPAVRLDPFRFFTSRYHRVARGLPPSVVGVPPGASGVVGSGLPIRIDDGNVGVSQVPWKPWWSLSVLFDPGRIRQAEWTKSKLPDTAPACVHDEGSRRLVISGLNHTTFDLTVYASQEGSPYHHARLASGCWSSFARRDSYPQGFSERFSEFLTLPDCRY